MSKKLISYRVSLLVMIAIAVSGCEAPAQRILGYLKAGEYDGFFIKRSGREAVQGFFNGRLEAGTAPVLAHGAFGDGAALSFTVEVTPTENKKIFKITLPGLTEQFLLVETRRVDACFLSPQGAELNARLCMNGAGLLLEYVAANGDGMILGFDPRATGGPAEAPPMRFTLDEVIDKAMSQSFDSRIQYEASVSSVETARAARLNLLPHVQIGEIFSFVNFSWGSLIGLVGDVAPFLFPSNWFNASAASRQADIDKYAYRIMQADAGNAAEGLVYQLLRDQRSLRVLEDYEAPITRLRDQLVQGEVLGAQQPGTANSLTAVLLSLEQMKVTYDAAIRGGKRALAQAMGLKNPGAVIDVEVGELPSLEHPIHPLPEPTYRLVADLSLELRQMNSLLDKRRNELRGRRFDWLNPHGGTPIGLGLPPTIAAGEASLREVAAQKEKLEATLREKVNEAFDTIAISENQYSVAQRNLSLQQAQVTQNQNAILLGNPISGIALQTALQSAMQSEIAKVEAECAYFVSVANINRLLYIGHYNQSQWSELTPPVRPEPLL